MWKMRMEEREQWGEGPDRGVQQGIRKWGRRTESRNFAEEDKVRTLRRSV